MPKPQKCSLQAVYQMGLKLIFNKFDTDGGFEMGRMIMPQNIWQLIGSMTQVFFEICLCDFLYDVWIWGAISVV